MINQPWITLLVPLSTLIVLLPGRERMSQPGATLPDAAIFWIRSTTVCARACGWDGEGDRDSRLRFRGCHICCFPLCLLWIKADFASLIDYCQVVSVGKIVAVFFKLEAVIRFFAFVCPCLQSYFFFFLKKASIPSDEEGGGLIG